MVGNLSPLKARREPVADAEALPPPPRSTTPLDFPVPPRRERSAADLARMIESEIIPRLMLAHGPDAGSQAPPGGAVGPRTLESFARMTLSSEAHALSAYVETLIQGGLSLEEVYVDLMIPTARRLGDDWNEDVISFTDVTIGLSRLQQVVRTLGHSIPARDADEDAPSAYFVPAPNEQHAFGLFILEDYFRRAGWRTWLDTAATREDTARTVRRVRHLRAERHLRHAHGGDRRHHRPGAQGVAQPRPVRPGRRAPLHREPRPRPGRGGGRRVRDRGRRLVSRGGRGKGPGRRLTSIRRRFPHPRKVLATTWTERPLRRL